MQILKVAIIDTLKDVRNNLTLCKKLSYSNLHYYSLFMQIFAEVKFMFN